MSISNVKRISAIAALSIAGLLAGCSPQGGAPAGGGKPGGGGPPPAEVGVVTVTPQGVGLATDLPGRLEATRVAQVRARVAGILQKRLFREGSDVKAGQVLFQIDAAPYRASYESARAVLARAEANLTQTSAQVKRFEPLIKANAISQQDYDNAIAARALAEADVQTGKAAVETAKINLGYATVTAPISGRIGRALVTEGALVGQGEATQLAVVQQIDPMYVNFTQSATDVLRLRKAVESGEFKRTGGGGASVRIALEDGTLYKLPGKLLFSDLSVDPSSGQIMLRAEIPNPQGLLLPGLYVRVQLEQARAEAGIVVPQQAVQRGTSGDSVMVVGADGKVSPRKVTIGRSVDAQWVVLDGLAAGEMVMVDGFQKLRGNAPVKPVPWKPAPAGASPQPASAGASAGASGAASAASSPKPAAAAASGG
jgi:membrane fusion protein (multidrug efflux system)